MQEPDYATKFMACGGTLILGESCKHVTRCHHIIDVHNNLIHSSEALEKTWIAKCWAICVLAFLLTVTEENLCLVIQFYWKGDN